MNLNRLELSLLVMGMVLIIISGLFIIRGFLEYGTPHQDIRNLFISIGVINGFMGVYLLILSKSQINVKERIFRNFFEYFLDHAVQCDDKMCVCKASTFQDLICKPELRNNPKYKDEIQEVLEK